MSGKDGFDEQQFRNKRDGQVGIRPPEFEVGEIVEAQKRKNPMGKFSPATVIARKVVNRGTTTFRTPGSTWLSSVCVMLSCGLCREFCGQVSNEVYL